MKTPSFIKKSIYSALVFFGTLLVLSASYATWNSVMMTASSGSTLSSSSWNVLVDNIIDLNSRWSRNGAALVFTGGNVGIGTEGPAYKLSVTGGASNLDGIYIQGNEPSGYAVITSESGVWAGKDLLIKSNIGNVSGIAIKQNGNIGVGTINPQAKLDVAGDIVWNAQVFKAYMASNYSHPWSWVKLPFNAVIFNTLKGTFDAANNRFTPTRAWYYQVGITGWSATGSTGHDRYAFGVVKSGVIEFISGWNYSANDTPLSAMSGIVYVNGTTDYIEINMFSAIAATIVGWGAGVGGHATYWYMNYLGM